MKNFFTILEMLIVVTILLFLTTGIFMVGSSMVKKYKKNQARAEIITISNAIVGYRNATGLYPPDYLSSSYNEDASIGGIGSWVSGSSVYEVNKKGWDELIDKESLAARNYLGAIDSDGLQNIVIARLNDSTIVDVDKKIKDVMEVISPMYRYSLTNFSKDFYIRNPMSSPRELVKEITEQIEYINAFPEYYSVPKGFGKAILSGKLNGKSVLIVQIYDFGEDIGGEISGDVGYMCQVKKRITRMSDFGTKWHKKTAQGTLKNLKMKVSSPNFSRKCGLSNKPFKCNDLASDPNFSCGWHNFHVDAWEGSYNSSESAKALYDHLCRPMKGRLVEGRPISLKYRNAKPFLDMPKSSLKVAGRPLKIACKGSSDSKLAYRLYGSGVFDKMDSYKLVDPWGKEYFYVSSRKEYLFDARVGLVKPHLRFDESDDYGPSRIGKIGILYDRVMPHFNNGAYDLASSGPDTYFVNWIARDYKVAAPAIGYGRRQNYNRTLMWGNIGTDGELFFIKLKPNETMLGEDRDNDNITNFTK